MIKKKKREIKEEDIEKKWHSYTGTGITASKGKNALALRGSIDGRKFAIVKLLGGCWTNSPMKVIEEINTSNLNKAKKRFDAMAKKLGFKEQEMRTVALLFI